MHPPPRKPARPTARAAQSEAPLLLRPARSDLRSLTQPRRARGARGDERPPRVRLEFLTRELAPLIAWSRSASRRESLKPLVSLSHSEFEASAVQLWRSPVRHVDQPTALTMSRKRFSASSRLSVDARASERATRAFAPSSAPADVRPRLIKSISEPANP